MAWITFSYDDGLKSNYQTMLPLHEKYNIPASLAIISDRAINPKFWDKYMTPKEIVDADFRGHEIVSHGVYHNKKFTEISDFDLSHELSFSQKVLNGFVKTDISAINIPFARYDDNVLKMASKYYQHIRLAGDKYNEIGGDTNLLYAFAINSMSTIERVKSLIDRAVTEDKWLVLMFHDIVDGDKPKGMYSNSTKFLDETLSYSQKYIKKGELEPKLFRDALQFLNPSHKKEEDKEYVLGEGKGYLITYHPAKEPTDKVLISFGGLPSTKTAKGFGSDFAIKMGYHHIFVAQAAGSQYQELDLKSFRDAVMPICNGKDVFTYGSSLGGYCAIYYAGVIDAQAISAAPKNSAHPTLKHNLKEYVKFNHSEFVDIPKSSKQPIIIYDPYQREESNFIRDLILPAYPAANLITVPYSGHLVLQVMSNHKILKEFIRGIVEDGQVISIDYDTECCHIWNFERGRVLARDGREGEAVVFLEKSLQLSYTPDAEKLIKKINTRV